MAEREIKFRSFIWHEEIEPGVTITREARYGEVVDLPADAIQRGEELGAFVTDEEEAPEVHDVEGMDDEELIEWVSSVTVNDVLAAANDDPEVADRLLEAENDATGNDPRAGVVNGLSKIIGQAD